MKLRAPEHDVDDEIATIKQGLRSLDNQQGSFMQQVIVNILSNNCLIYKRFF